MLFDDVLDLLPVAAAAGDELAGADRCLTQRVDGLPAGQHHSRRQLGGHDAAAAYSAGGCIDPGQRYPRLPWRRSVPPRMPLMVARQKVHVP